MTTLTDLQTKVLMLLGDPSGARYTTAQIIDALRLALADYSRHASQFFKYTFTLAVDGRDQFLPTSGSNIDRIIQAWYPYTPGDDNPPVLENFYSTSGSAPLHIGSSRFPVAGDSILLFCSKPHTIQGLDAAAITTVPFANHIILIVGAAAYASVMRSGTMAEAYTAKQNLIAFSNQMMNLFSFYLSSLRAESARTDAIFQSSSWKLDQWD